VDLHVVVEFDFPKELIVVVVLIRESNQDELLNTRSEWKKEMPFVKKRSKFWSLESFRF
jgi:hypothetical protein